VNSGTPASFPNTPEDLIIVCFSDLPLPDSLSGTHRRRHQCTLTLANCVSLLLGSLDVVTTILGSLMPAFLYSSSMCVSGAVGRGSSSISFLSSSSSFFSSVGIGLPAFWRQQGIKQTEERKERKKWKRYHRQPP